MTTRLKLLAIPCLAVSLLPAFAQGGGQTQPTDPTAQAPTTPAQTTPPTFPEPAAKQAPDDTTASATPEGVRMFAGSIAREKSAFVLKAGNTTFKLDDQSQAKQYKGRNVKVMGSLDKSTNTIHVEKIEASDSM